MVTHKFLALALEVRILLSQQTISKEGIFYSFFFISEKHFVYLQRRFNSTFMEDSNILPVDNWIDITKVDKIPDDVTMVHIDTRDWHGIMKASPIDWKNKEGSINLPRIYDATRFTKDNRFRIPSDDLLKLIKNLKEWTGGDGEWRMFNLLSTRTPSGWFKYIRCYRVPGEDSFVVTDGNSAIRISEFREDNIDKEHLSKY